MQMSANVDQITTGPLLSLGRCEKRHMLQFFMGYGKQKVLLRNIGNAMLALAPVQQQFVIRLQCCASLTQLMSGPSNLIQFGQHVQKLISPEWLDQQAINPHLHCA